MENNENFVEQTENVEQTTEQIAEQPEKTFSQADVDRMVKEKLDEVMPGKIARTRARIEKEYQRKYGDLETVLKAGTGMESVEEMTDAFRDHYEKKGRQIPKQSTYSNGDIEVLAKADAAEIIRGGFDEVVEEADRLKNIGFENMTARDKAVFVALTNHIKETETSRELAKIGVTEDVYNSKEFKDFAGMFAPSTPIAKIYQMYEKETQPKKEVRSMGSMKDTTPDTGVKDFYSYEEASKFSKEDFDKNPELYKRVQESMAKWK